MGHQYKSQFPGSFCHHHHHQSLNHEGCWGTADDFATSFLHRFLVLWNSESFLLHGIDTSSISIAGCSSCSYFFVCFLLCSDILTFMDKLWATFPLLVILGFLKCSGLCSSLSSYWSHFRHWLQSVLECSDPNSWWHRYECCFRCFLFSVWPVELSLIVGRNCSFTAETNR